jgi:hypothetical protein
MNPVLRDVLLALPPLLFGLTVTYRLIWPRWKLPGKIVFYVAVVALLSVWIGSWSVVLGWVHQMAGILFHIRFSRLHGFTWYAVEDPDRYVALSRAAVGLDPGFAGDPDGAESP